MTQKRDDMRQRAASRLGVILPLDGDAPYEWLDMRAWLVRRGLSGLEVAVARTEPIGGHEREALMFAGSRRVLDPPAARLARTGAAAVVWACTSGSFIGGPAWSRAQLEALRAMTGRPATTATAAMIAAARALGAEAVDVLAPYPDEVTEMFVGCLAAAGVKTQAVLSLGTVDGPASFRLDIRAETARARERLGPGGRALLLPDTAVDTLALLDELEAIAGRPVVTANQACLWHGLSLAAGRAPVLEGAGTLFREQAPIPG